MPERYDGYNRWLRRGMPDRTAGERPALNRDRMYEGEDRYPDRDDGSRHREDEWRDRADWSAGEGRFYRNPAAAVPDDYDRDRAWRYRQYPARDEEDFRENYYRDYDLGREEYARRTQAGRFDHDYRDYPSREPYPRTPEDRSRFTGRSFDEVRHYDRDYDRSHWGSPLRREPDDRTFRREIDRDRNLDHFRGGYRDEDDYWRRERETMRERDLQRRETLDSIRSRRDRWRS